MGNYVCNDCNWKSSNTSITRDDTASTCTFAAPHDKEFVRDLIAEYKKTFGSNYLKKKLPQNYNSIRLRKRFRWKKETKVTVLKYLKNLEGLPGILVGDMPGFHASFYCINCHGFFMQLVDLEKRILIENEIREKYKDRPGPPATWRQFNVKELMKNGKLLQSCPKCKKNVLIEHDFARIEKMVCHNCGGIGLKYLP